MGRLRTPALAWALPIGIVLCAAAWLIPVGVHTAAASDLRGFVVGTWLFLLIWLVWAGALAALTTALVAGRREPGPVWGGLQCALLAVLLIGTVPPLLCGLGSGPIETVTTGFAFLVLPLLAIVLSAAQGLVLFLRA